MAISLPVIALVYLKPIDVIFSEEFVLLSNSVGLNRDFKKMLSEHAEFEALSLKDIRTAADGTKKVDLSFSYFSSLIL